MENWSQLPEYPNYNISDCGGVMSLYKNRLLKPNSNNGYVQVWLTNESGSRWHYIHRLVAQLFRPNPNNYKEVNHINGAKADNRAENLQWCTHSENIQHLYKSLLYVAPSGVNNKRTGTKLSQEAKDKIKASKERYKGENHPKFKGWYVLGDGARYASANAAADHLGIHSMTMRRYNHIRNYFVFVPKQG